MSQTVGFLVDLSGITLADSGSTWIQALPLGTYLHPVYGEIKITPDRVQKFAANVTAKVIDKQPDIDYDHKKRTDHAAGWVEAAEARPDGLWIQVDWTPKARQMLKDKEYLDESAKQRMSIEPLDDKQIQALLARAFTAPKAIKDRAAVFAGDVN